MIVELPERAIGRIVERPQSIDVCLKRERWYTNSNSNQETDDQLKIIVKESTVDSGHDTTLQQLALAIGSLDLSPVLCALLLLLPGSSNTFNTANTYSPTLFLGSEP